jgi:hypothetical protein
MPTRAWHAHRVEAPGDLELVERERHAGGLSTSRSVVSSMVMVRAHRPVPYAYTGAKSFSGCAEGLLAPVRRQLPSCVTISGTT